MSPRARPFPNDCSEKIQRTRSLARVKRWCWKEFSEDFPPPMQLRSSCGLNARDRCFVRIDAPTFGIVRHADGGIAVGGDVDEPAKRPGELVWVSEQQRRIRKCESQMNQYGRALGHDCAVRQNERWDLLDWIDAFKLRECGVGFPCRGSNPFERRVATLKRDSDGR